MLLNYFVMKIQIIFLLTLLVLASCTKDEPPVGDYSGTFSGKFTIDTVIHNYSREFILHISESNKTSLFVQYENNTSELSKDKHRIFGVLDFYESGGSGTEGHSWGPINIIGTWTNDSGRYTISGDFSRIYKIIYALDSSVYEFSISGTFEIKSNF
jgi:hypothetical protein